MPYTYQSQMTGEFSEITPMAGMDMWILKMLMRNASGLIDHYERLPNRIRKGKLLEAIATYQDAEERIKLQLRHELGELMIQHMTEKAGQRRAGCDRTRAEQMQALRNRATEWAIRLQAVSAGRSEPDHQTSATVLPHQRVKVPVQMEMF